MSPHRRTRSVLTLASLALFVGAASAQSRDADILLELERPLDFNLEVELAPGTEEVVCHQEPLDPVQVGNVKVRRADEPRATISISIPEPRIRCMACNTYGCSEFSPNAGVVAVHQANLLDRTNDGKINVNDMIAWARAINRWILTNGNTY
jgi:hypothetical protein